MRLIKKLSYLAFASLILLGCEGNKTIDEIFDTVTRGAVFRTISTEGADFNLLDQSSSFAVTAEVEDHNDGALLERVEAYVSFVDNLDDGVDNSVAEAPLATIPSSAFAPGPNGFPSTTFEYTFGDALTALGLNVSNVNGGDNFNLRFVLHLTDGRSFTNTNTGATVSGGSFFSSPFLYTQSVVCLFDEPDFFSGSYLMEQLTGADPFYASETFGDTQIVDILADGTIRQFNFSYFPGIFNSDYNFFMNLVCGEIQVTGSINAGGLGCGGANIGFASGSPISTYDQSFSLASDDVMLVNVSDFEPDGNCDTGSYSVELRFTEQ